jgi:hypothetical protein
LQQYEEKNRHPTHYLRIPSAIQLKALAGTEMEILF